MGYKLLDGLATFLFMFGLYGYFFAAIPAIAWEVVFHDGYGVTVLAGFFLTFSTSIILFIGMDRWENSSL